MVAERPTDLSTEDAKHLWSNILKEVTDKGSVKLPHKKALLVLGGVETGKSSLISRLQGIENTTKSPGLEYHYIDVKDEDRDDQTQLSVWLLDGAACYTPLLKCALTPKNFADCMAVVVVSMSEPWNIMDQLEHWVEVLERYINSIEISPEDLTEYKESLLHHFRNYVEPDRLLAADVHSPATPSQPLPSATTVAARRTANPLHPATAALLGLNSPARPTVPEFTIATEFGDAIDREETDEQKITELPITPGALTNNLGIPLVVVVTKTDNMEVFEQGNEFNDEHFDLIQMHIRRFCLSYGAALFYVSVKEDKNCDLLNRYIQHRIYGFPFSQSAYVIEKECIFVPTGWDNEKKISILEENLAKFRPGDAYSTIIPAQHAPSPTKEAEVVSTDEQVFLSRMYTTIQRNQDLISGSGEAGVGQLAGGVGGLNGSLAESAMLEQLTAAAAAATVNSSASRPSSGSPRTPASMRAKPGAGGGSGGMSGGGSGLNASASEGVLASFFNSLLSKRSPAGGQGVTTVGPTAASVTSPNGSTSDNSTLSTKDMHSELERLAQTSRETLSSPQGPPVAEAPEVKVEESN